MIYLETTLTSEQYFMTQTRQREFPLKYIKVGYFSGKTMVIALLFMTEDRQNLTVNLHEIRNLVMNFVPCL